MDEPIVILCTVPNSEIGESLARGLVEAQHAACVNIASGVLSIYRWNGAVQKEHEAQLLIKTRASRLERVSTYLREHHPYEVPEILALPTQGGSSAYARWIFESTP
jgi:periplasmic divalent cation tolerance protein